MPKYTPESGPQINYGLSNTRLKEWRTPSGRIFLSFKERDKGDSWFTAYQLEGPPGADKVVWEEHYTTREEAHFAAASKFDELIHGLNQ